MRKLGERSDRQGILLGGRVWLTLEIFVAVARGGIFMAERRQPDAALLQTLLEFGPVLVQLIEIAPLQNRMGFDAIAILFQLQ